ncbi:MAG: DEAD/DEAH box helicase [Nanoarchaeota archaeon]|nr:DEAD/DEAH box helicase [Nanoarchaeota archaeon]
MIPEHVQKVLDKQGIKELRPSQKKSIDAGLFEGNNLLVCTPTASGKTLVSELAILNLLLSPTKKGRPIAVYVVPLRALASEKYKDFSRKYPSLQVALTSGDMDSDDRYLENYDIIITTSEKFDSLLRHHAPWLDRVKLLTIDEIHLLNDVGRGPTLEILITIVRRLIPDIQLIGLSATIGNSKELATWLDARLVEDTWRPVRLDKGILYEDTLYFPEKE